MDEQEKIAIKARLWDNYQAQRARKAEQKQALIASLGLCNCRNPMQAAVCADNLLLRYINDTEIMRAFASVRKPYSHPLAYLAQQSTESQSLV